MTANRTVHVLVHGRVQGVGFRAWIHHHAELHGLKGWVRNRRDGAVEAVMPQGRALGVFLDPRLTVREVRLGPGDAAVFYTDGITEARGPDGSFFGEERLHALLRSCATLDAQAIAERLKNVTLEYGEGSPRDDLAVLVLRVPG